MCVIFYNLITDPVLLRTQTGIKFFALQNFIICRRVTHLAKRRSIERLAAEINYSNLAINDNGETMVAVLKLYCVAVVVSTWTPTVAEIPESCAAELNIVSL